MLAGQLTRRSKPHGDATVKAASVLGTARTVGLAPADAPSPAQHRTPSEGCLPEGGSPHPLGGTPSVGAQTPSEPTLLPTTLPCVISLGNDSFTRVRRVVVVKPNQIKDLRQEGRERLFCTAPAGLLDS